jgi:chorismate mutase/prephenate dehydrogenase
MRRTPEERLAEARRRIDRLDAELVRVAAERLAAAAEAGRAKAAMGQSLVDFAREREVLGRVRRHAGEAGLEAAVAEDLVARLIEASTSRQEAERLSAAAVGQGRQAVVVGGAGRMGRWLVRFLAGSGFGVHVLDPAEPAGNLAAAAALPAADLVLVAVPPSEAARLYDAWAARPPRGVVADVCSVKAPLVPALRRLQRAGGRVASLHPMFGPATTVLRGQDVVVCDTGDAEAAEQVRALFAATPARVVPLGLDEHDRLMADVLAHAHAAAIAYAASARGGAVQSATSRRLREVAAAVVRESPRAYHEIQAGNPHADAAVARLQESVARLRAVVASGDPARFAALLDEGRRSLEAPA